MKPVNDPTQAVDLAAHRRFVRSLARSLVADASAADDLVQDTWVAALTRGPREGGSLRAWFATVLRRRAAESRRAGASRSRREEVAARGEALPSTLDMVERAAVQRDLVQAVLDLDEPYRTTILWRFLEELPPREIARRAGVPVVPGSDGPVEDEKRALEVARHIGFPLMIKASAGGGGRGMRIARNEPSLVAGFHAASAEAEAAFGDGTVYLEKLIENPRHVEVQILADRHGNVVHLFERDCSVQRRHQKLVEESPSPALTPAMREKICQWAVQVARAAHYTNAGTVEFLLARDGSCYFIEVNARIQVEHTVTELVTGIDLIQQQILVASGERLAFAQEDVRCQGSAIECRINAEDPERDFLPSPGRIDLFVPPGGPGVRMDSHCYSGYRIPPNYDSMIGKLLVHRARRDLSIRTMLRALDEFVIEGVKTTVPILRSILSHSDFRSGDHDTGFVERYYGTHPGIPVQGPAREAAR